MATTIVADVLAVLFAARRYCLRRPSLFLLSSVAVVRLCLCL